MTKKLLVFKAPWCGPCKVLEPLVDEVSIETGLYVEKINVDENQKLAMKYGIRTVPTLILVDGDEQKKLHGLQTKSKLLEFIK